MTGSEAFGADADGRPTGSEAFGGAEPQQPLKGALLFGNDPGGNPTGSEAFGGAEGEEPLKGALLFGNDPAGNPTGSEAFGEADARHPLRGALLFGNDPAGGPTGSEAFGGSDPQLAWRGSEAFGAAQLVPERLGRDAVGYDFGGRLLRADADGLAGIRRDPNDHLRERLLRLLGRRLGCEAERLRHGLGEGAIPWGRLRRDRSLDRKLAEELRRWYRRAPGEVLGIGQVRDLLEGSARMHSFTLRCEWDKAMVELQIQRGGEVVGFGTTALHKAFRFFLFRDLDRRVVGYADALVPRERAQEARIRGPQGEPVAVVRLESPGLAEALAPDAPARFGATILDSEGQPVIRLEEERATERYFRAALRHLPDEAEAGLLEDTLVSGKVRTVVELDVAMPRLVSWGIAAVIADLARLRRQGWPDKPTDGEPEAIESVADALGPRRRPDR